MFCPRAMNLLFGVSVCALIGGCGTQSPVSELTRPDRAQSMDSALADNHTRGSVISTELMSPPSTAHSVSCEEIIEWSIRGFNDDMIIDRIDRSNSAFHLSTSEEIHLRDAGVSDEVIRTMKATAG